MKGLLFDDGDYSELEEKCIRKYYGDEAYERMKADEEAERKMSRRQRRKKRAISEDDGMIFDDKNHSLGCEFQNIG